MPKSIVLVAALVAGFSTTPAFAHAHLKHSTPASGVSGPAPTAITLEFSEGVVPGLSNVTLADAAGHNVHLGKAESGPKPTTLIVPISDKLAAGAYVVKWRAVSTDTHRTQGSFRFTVAP